MSISKAKNVPNLIKSTIFVMEYQIRRTTFIKNIFTFNSKKKKRIGKNVSYFFGSQPSFLTRYQKSLSVLLFEYISLLNFTWHTVKFHDPHHTIISYSFFSWNSTTVPYKLSSGAPLYDLNYTHCPISIRNTYGRTYFLRKYIFLYWKQGEIFFRNLHCPFESQADMHIQPDWQCHMAVYSKGQWKNSKVFLSLLLPLKVEQHFFREIFFNRHIKLK